MHQDVILAAVDLEDSTERVLDAAIQCATESAGRRLVVLMVAVPTSTGLGLAVPQVVPLFRPDLDLAPVRERTERALSRFRARHAGVLLPPTEARIEMGRPADEILWHAAQLDAERIVLGSHGRRGLKRVLLGSVAENVVRLAGCPVLVVRERLHTKQDSQSACPECTAARRYSDGSDTWCAVHKVRNSCLVNPPSVGSIQTSSEPPRA